MSSKETENRGIDEKMFAFLCSRWDAAPVNHTLAIKLTHLGEGTAGMKTTAGSEYSTVRNRLHGGIISTILDSAMGWAILSLGRVCVTIDMYLNYFANAFEGDELIAEGNVIYTGNRTAVAEATLYNDKGILVAKSRGTFSVKMLNLQ